MAKLFKNKIFLLSLILTAGLILRLFIVDKGWHVDLFSNAGWGEWIYEHGPRRFYENQFWTYSWPTQPPLINSVYAWNKKLYIELLGRSAGIEHQLNKLLPGDTVFWLTDWVEWFGYGKINNEIPFQTGYLVTMKLLPILADLVITAVIYYLGKKNFIWPLIYVLSPFSWYLSAGWGQYDGVSFALTLLGFLSVFSSLAFVGPSLVSLAVLIKPTSLILVPLFAYVYFRKMGKRLNMRVLGILFPFLIFWATTQSYTHKNPFEFARYDLKRIVFEKSEPRLTVNSFNFWRVLIGDKGVVDNVRWLSLGVFAGLNIAGVYHWEKKGRKIFALWQSLFLVAMGSWLLVTGMLERYAFAGVVFGLLVVMEKPKLFKYWLVMSLVFWVNMYYHWWWPGWLWPLKDLLTWNGDIVTRGLSFIQIWAFAKLILGSFRILPDHPAQKQKSRV